MKKILPVLPLILLILFAPFCRGADEVRQIGSSLGFIPVLDFAKEGEENTYYSEQCGIRLTVLEVERNQQNRDLQALQNGIAQMVPHTAVTVDENMNDRVNAVLMKFTDAGEGQEMYRWVYLMEGATKFANIFVLGPAASFRQFETELITMLRSFRWLDDSARAVYSLALPIGWQLALDSDLLQVFTPDGMPYDQAPTCITVIREERPVTAEERGGYLEALAAQYPGAVVLKSAERMLNACEAHELHLAVQREDGMEMVFFNCLIYTRTCTFVVMGVRNDELTEDAFEAVIQSFTYSGLAK